MDHYGFRGKVNEWLRSDVKEINRSQLMGLLLKVELFGMVFLKEVCGFADDINLQISAPTVRQ